MCSYCLFAWQSPWNRPHFPRSRFNQRCFSNSPGACFLTQNSTTLLARVYYWDEMYHDSCLFADLKWVSDDEECSLKWGRLVCELPVCLFEKSMQGCIVNQQQNISCWAGIQTLNHLARRVQHEERNKVWWAHTGVSLFNISAHKYEPSGHEAIWSLALEALCQNLEESEEKRDNICCQFRSALRWKRPGGFMAPQHRQPCAEGMLHHVDVNTEQAYTATASYFTYLSCALSLALL